MLQKYIADISHVSCYATLQLKEDSTYEEVPAQVMDHEDLVLHNNTIPQMKVFMEEPIFQRNQYLVF